MAFLGEFCYSQLQLQFSYCYSLDLSEYIKEEPASHDITVTLRPVKKSVLSGSLQFILSSIMLEDGIPR